MENLLVGMLNWGKLKVPANETEGRLYKKTFRRWAGLVASEGGALGHGEAVPRRAHEGRARLGVGPLELREGCQHRVPGRLSICFQSFL